MAITPENGPLYAGYSIMRNVMSSETESELGGLFENYQKSTYIWDNLAEMGHPQQPTPVSNENTSESSIMNLTAKKDPEQ